MILYFNSQEKMCSFFKTFIVVLENVARLLRINRVKNIVSKFRNKGVINIGLSDSCLVLKRYNWWA